MLRWCLCLLLLASAGWHMHIYNRRMWPNNSDLIQRWVGARAAFAGRDPYSPAVRHEIQTAYAGWDPDAIGRPLTREEAVVRWQSFLYPAPIILILAPFVALPWEYARHLFAGVSVLAFAVGVWMWIRRLIPRNASYRAWLLLLIFAAWPTWWAIRLEQPGLLVAAFLLLAVESIARGRQVAGGILLALATIKPQAAMPILIWYTLWAWHARAIRLAGGFAGALLLMFVLTEHFVPGWLPHWLASLHGYREDNQADLPLVNLCGRIAGTALTAAAAVPVLAVFWKARRAAAASWEAIRAAALALAFAPFLTPTHFTLIYNQILLIGAFLVLLSRDPISPPRSQLRWMAFASLAVSFALVPIAVFLESVLGPHILYDGLPFLLNSLLPIPVLCALVALHSPFLPNDSVPDRFA
ncbi:glycosyltransferase family 87 protein [Silvibacterium sp.]|uniref:glycosyltransferase family 87 protein n=1 Tax=Silvibacterium sp. TaxID=1964179 RepID=UPI0039E5C88C